MANRCGYRRWGRRMTTSFLMMLMMMVAATRWTLDCEALSSAASTANSIRIAVMDPSVAPDLKLLQDCRRTAFDPDKQNWLDNQRDFVNAQSVQDGKNLCAVAFAGDNKEIVGSADLWPKESGENVISNVFVRPDCRKQGIGKRLIVEGLEELLVKKLPSKNKVDDNEAILSLDVYTNNAAAMTLYQSLGYEPSSAVHAGTLKVAQTFGANLLVSFSKTVPIANNSD